MANNNNVVPPEIDIDKELKILQLKELQEKRDKEAEEKDIRRKAQLANIQSVKDAMRQTTANQDSCAHKKPSGASAIAGQRMHSHKYLWLCQYCGKQWTGNDLPTHLRIDSELVGGPQA